MALELFNVYEYIFTARIRAKAGVLRISNIHGHILQKRREGEQDHPSLSAVSGLLILFIVGHGG